MELLTVVEKQHRVLRWRSLMLDLDQHRLRIGSSVVAASRAEFDLLHLLISRRNVPLSKASIMSWLFGPEHGRDLRQVDVFVARLRQTLGEFGLGGLIQTVSGRGYAVMNERGDDGFHPPYGLIAAGGSVMVEGFILPMRESVGAERR